jgi:adenosylcobyric acid synthase
MGPVRGALMVCGTTSNAGKSTIVAGLCRLLARDGVRVAPFKAQNMALNSFVTAAGHEIGRAQAMQAFAAGIEPEVSMNPILLKPTGECTSQVVVAGRPIGDMSAREYHEHKPRLHGLVLDALVDLRARFDVVLCEGAGSPAEINLLDRDIVNLRIACDAGIDAIVVGDIEPGGVFASLYGTVALLPDEHRRRVRGFVINKLRGDPTLLLDGCAQLHERTGIPTIGVVPWLDGLDIDAEDSLALRDRPHAPAPTPDELDVVVVQLPRISNFTDFDPLVAEPGVQVRFVRDPGRLGRPDLIILPGTKATVEDLAWLRAHGFDTALSATGATVLGICGGYQMLGESIDDEIESCAGRVEGFALLPVATTFDAEKTTDRCQGTSLGHSVDGYRIHHGRVHPRGGATFVELGGTVDGVQVGSVYGTTLHGLFEADAFRRAFLTQVAAHARRRFVPGTESFAEARARSVDTLADTLATHLDVDRLLAWIAHPMSTTSKVTDA